jgi:hypothetical protein
MPLNDNRTVFFTRQDFTAALHCVELYTADEVRALFPTGAENLINGDIAGFEDRHDTNPLTRGQWGRIEIVNQDAKLEIFDENGAECGTVMLATMLAQHSAKPIHLGGIRYSRIVAISQLLAIGCAVKLGKAIYRLART